MNKLAIGKSMIVVALLAVTGSLLLFSYTDVRLLQVSPRVLIVAVIVWFAVAWALIWRGKLTLSTKPVTEGEQSCRRCNRWVPPSYLREGRYCYECYKELTGSPQTESPNTIRSHKTKRNRSKVAEFPYKAELDRRVFDFLAKEEKDMATWVQAVAESDGDQKKAQARYFMLRYQQMEEVGELEGFINEIAVEQFPRFGRQKSKLR
jgi:hypothetical protein